MTRFAAFVVPCIILLTSSMAVAQSAALPPGEANAKAVVEKSPRHPDYEEITVPGREKPVRAFITFPEVKEKAPVVIVIHEIFGLSDWIKGVTDQLAADGFIAIATSRGGQLSRSQARPARWPASHPAKARPLRTNKAQSSGSRSKAIWK